MNIYLTENYEITNFVWAKALIESYEQCGVAASEYRGPLIKPD
jgi:hypothetical protein